MKKPCLYILCGFPFSGKTTLARALIGALGIKHVAIDDGTLSVEAWIGLTFFRETQGGWGCRYSQAIS